MISLEELRALEPKLKDTSDKELLEIRRLLYAQAELALECYWKMKKDKKKSAS